MEKVYPKESGIFDSFAFLRWYVEKEVSLESSDEAELLVGWGCKVVLMDLQWEIVLKINSLKM